MEIKMSFWEKLMYRMGLKDPTKAIINSKNVSYAFREVKQPSPTGRIYAERIIRSPFEIAALQGDLKSLDFFAKYSKISKSALASALLLVPSATALKRLENMGAQLEPKMLPKIAKNITSQMIYDGRPTDYEDNVNFLRKYKISLNFHDQTGRSLYDGARNKKDWLNAANPAEIGHEFRKAVASGDIQKVKEMLTLGMEKVNVNATNSQKCDALNYALQNNDTEMIKLLYENGANLYSKDKNGLNAFQRTNSEMQAILVNQCIKKDDLFGLSAAAEAGIKFNNSEYLLTTNNPNILSFFVLHGASIDEALNTLHKKNHLNKKQAEQLEILSLIKRDLERNLLEHNFRQAVAKGQLDKVQHFIDENPNLNINATNKNGRDAMSYAIQRNDYEMALFLYKNGAFLANKDANGKNAFERATPAMWNMLIEQCIKQKDLKGIDAAIEAITSRDIKGTISDDLKNRPIKEVTEQAKNDAKLYVKLNRLKKSFIQEKVSRTQNNVLSTMNLAKNKSQNG